MVVMPPMMVVMVPMVVMAMMPAMMAMVMVIETRRRVVAGAGVIALFDPAPAVPDRPADHSHILNQPALAGEARLDGPRQGLRAAPGKGAREGEGGGEQHATH